MSQLVVIVLEAEDFARDHVGESPLPSCYGIFSGTLTEFLRLRGLTGSIKKYQEYREDPDDDGFAYGFGYE